MCVPQGHTPFPPKQQHVDNEPRPRPSYDNVTERRQHGTALPSGGGSSSCQMQCQAIYGQRVMSKQRNDQLASPRTFA